MNKEVSLRAILSGLGCMVVGSSLANIAVPTRAVAFGFDTIIIGLLSVFYYAGFVLSCFQTPRLVRRVGHIRAFISAAALISICTLSYAVSSNALIWCLLRCVGGFCMATIYMIAESWVNDVADSSNRGRIITYYRIVDLSAIVSGQVLVGAFEINGVAVFMAANIMMSAGVIPLALTTSSGPRPIQSIRLSWRKVFSVSRIASLTALAAGLSSGAYFGLGPAFAKGSGIHFKIVGVFMGAPILAAVVFQFFVGKMADRFDRERLLALLAILAALAGFALFFMAQEIGFLLFAVCLWGGLAMPLYSLALAIANDRCESSDFLDVSGGLLLIYSLGAVAGPAIASSLMQVTTYRMLFCFIGAVHLLTGLYVFWRRNIVIKPVRLEQREEFVEAPNTTPVIYEMDPRNDTQRHQ